jgi:hypothetical protein
MKILVKRISDRYDSGYANNYTRNIWIIIYFYELSEILNKDYLKKFNPIQRFEITTLVYRWPNRACYVRSIPHIVIGIAHIYSNY